MSDASPLAGQRPVWLDNNTKSIMERAIAREQSLSRMLMTYIVTGLVFMLLPGTFLGVWNLIKISNREEAESRSPFSYRFCSAAFTSESSLALVPCPYE